jgi:hypothetical protein
MKKILLSIFLTLALLAGGMGVQPARAAVTWTVNSLNDPGNGFCDLVECTLREALAVAGPSDTINIPISGVIQLGSQLAINIPLAISGPGASNLIISGNFATRVFSLSSPNYPIIISGVTIADGYVSGAPVNDGAGVYNLGILHLDNVILDYNTSTGNNGGGAIYNGSKATLIVTNSAFTENYSPTRGGAIANYGSANISNSVFWNNIANNGNGGGIFSFGYLTVNNSAFSENASTANGSGIYNGIAPLTLKNTILANGSGVDCYNGAITKPPVVAGNLIETNASGQYACGTPVATADPKLSSLDYYGGSTPTFGLLPGSPAIDSGHAPSCAATDQRGLSRVGTCDIGPFEVQGFTLSISGGDNQSAPVNNPFANPLTVSVAPINPGDPVNGGAVTFTPPVSGAGAVISGSPDTIAGGVASVTATANGTPGSYTVAASAAGAASVNFNLTNTTAFVLDTQINSHPPALTNSANAAFTFSSNDPLAAFECSLDGSAFAACLTPLSYTGLSDGSHTFRVRAKDASNNVDTTPASFTWTIDTVAPDTNLDSYPTNPSYGPAATFTFSSPDSSAAFECSLESAAFTACASPHNYSSLTQGLHTFRVRAKDPAGNVDATPATYMWTVYLTFTSTFVSAGSQDGWVLESTETSNIGGAFNATAATLAVGDSASRQQYRSFLSFNTGSLPDSAVIVSARIKVKQQSITGGGDPFAIFNGMIVDIRNGYFGASGGLQATDFQAAASDSQSPLSPAPVTGWYTFALSSSLFPHINLLLGFQSGLTQFRLRFNLDDNNNGVANYISFHSGNTFAAADRPVLEVNYYVP